MLISKKSWNLFLICSFLYIILAANLSPVFAQSEPGEEWEWRNPLPQGNTLNGVTYGDGQFVAVGDAGTILTFMMNQNGSYKILEQPFG